jgi:peptidoglycan/LPS O-acetylase OafA/YrhL
MSLPHTESGKTSRVTKPVRLDTKRRFAWRGEPMNRSSRSSPPSASADTAGYIPEIDALRAVAVIAVMVFHLNEAWLPGGYTGVDVFFAISGYVISSSILGHPSRQLPTFLLRFYARRVLRIIPALLVCLFVTAVATALFIPDSWLSHSNFQTAKFAFLGLSNIALMRTDDAYFDPRVEFNPYTHTWSLGIEEQFYVVFPTLFFIWMAYRFAVKGGRVAASAILPILLLVSLAYCAYITTHNPLHAYYGLGSRFWELAAGALLFQLHTVLPAWKRWGSASVRAAEATLSAILVLTAFFFTPARDFPYPWAIATILGTIGLIDGLLSDAGRRLSSAQIFRSTALVWIGKRSYSLYLWHWPVYVLLRWTVGLASWPSRVIAVTVVVFLAMASYRFVERPARYLRATTDRRRLVVVAAAVAAVLAVGKLAGQIAMRQTSLSLSVTAKQPGLWHPEEWIPKRSADAGLCRVISESRSLRSGGRVETYKPAGCVGETSTATLFVTGNSHALAYITLLSKLASTGKYKVEVYHLTGCGFLSLSEPIGRETADCQRFYREIEGDILRDGRVGDVLFLPSLRLPRFGDQWASFPEAEARKQVFGTEATRLRDSAVTEAPPILKPLLDAGINVVLEAPKPIFRAPAYRCADWFNKNNPICAPGLTVRRDELLEYRRPMLEAMKTLAHADARIAIWDPFDTLCPGEECRSVMGGVPVFFDGDHLSGAANEMLYPGFTRFLMQTRTPSSVDQPRTAGFSHPTEPPESVGYRCCSES